MIPRNEIIQGDCTQVLRNLPSESVDLVITDPPYFINYRDRNGRWIKNDLEPNGVLGAFDDVYRVLKPDTLCVCFYGWGSVDAFFRAWTSAGFLPVGHLVWRKDYSIRRRKIVERTRVPV